MTIGDVAIQAGVSVATVSKVVNGRYGVSATTSARVADVISELGYEASLGARSLRSTRTGILGVLLYAGLYTAVVEGLASGLVPADAVGHLSARLHVTHGPTLALRP